MSNSKFPFKEKIRYRFENTLSAGTIALIGWLAVASVLIVLLAGAFIAFSGLRQAEGESLSFGEATWQSLMRALDSGAVGGDSGWAFRTVMLLVTIGGIFVVSALIGVLNAGLEAKIEQLRKGRSKVLENGHTLLLGWSPKIFSIISELVMANTNQVRPRIVILADKDKVEMEDEIRAKIGNTHNTKIICRTGIPHDLTDIQIVNPDDAGSIIIISPEDPEADTYVIKSVLALTNNPKRKQGKYHIVAEIQEENNLEAAELVGNGETIFVLSGDMISRLTAQTCRQSGVSVVIMELLGFEGEEIYFKEEQRLVGKSFREAVFSSSNSAIFGIVTQAGKVLLNPAAETLIQPGDKLIAISEDDDTITISPEQHYPISVELIKKAEPRVAAVEKTLILGWNEKALRIIQELDSYVAPGSMVTVMAERENIESQIIDLGTDLKHQKVEFIYGSITSRSNLETLNAEAYNHIIVLSYADLPVQEADAKTLVCLLHLRSIAETSQQNMSIVSEMLDIRNRTLAEVAKADDFIVSDSLVSLILCQLSQNKNLKAVFDELFDSEGCEIYLKPITDFVHINTTVNFYTVLESALQKNQIAIGYRLREQSSLPNKAYGVVINPKKSEKIQFSAEDKVIVIAQG